MQKNWIGKSRGADIRFSLDREIAGFDTLPVYTTRPDTLMGVSYLSLAAEHPIALALAIENTPIAEFIAECKAQSVAEADMAVMDKKGIATGLTATHPLSGESIPIWIANYVLMDYGSGAVMAVPAHDERDFAFANRYELPMTQVIESRLDDSDFDSSQWQEWYSRKSDTQTINSAEFSGLDFNGAFNAITAKLSTLGKGEVKTNYRLRDWGVSRQRYWGSPIPMLSLPEGGEIPVPADRLPVLLPEDVIMDGVRSPIKADPEWCKTELNGQSVVHETDTFDTFMESSWYYARFTCPDFQDGILDSERANYWLPVDQYVGGIEHAILHLLYARFFHKLLRDDGFVSSNEPFKRLLCQGMVLAESFYRNKEDGSKEWFNPSDVQFERDEKGKILSAYEINSGQAVEIGGMTKMSKSKNNGIDPQTAIQQYGADTVRVFTMFAAPPEQTLEWNDDGVAGAQRFLRRLWTYCNEQRELIQQGKSDLNNNSHLAVENLTDSAQERRHSIHSSLEKALVDFNKSQFNTVIAACMTILNQLPNHEQALNDSHMAGVAAEGSSLLVRLLAPIAPHICHQLWQDLWPEMNCDILCADWPVVDPSALTLSSIEMVVQVNGKVRAKIKVAADANNEKIESLALEDENVGKFITDKTIRKVIVVPSKLINIVAN